MIATNIDGQKVADEIRASLKDQVDKFSSPPGLAMIMVGDSKGKFVEMKKQACLETGIFCFCCKFSVDILQDKLVSKIVELNGMANVHGIHIQMPLPKHLNQEQVLASIDPEKDVDGMHPCNVAKLCQSHVRWNWKKLDSILFNIPPTPQGCIELLDYYDISIKSKNAVVVGRSNLVGTPVARLLMHRDATVTIVHSKTLDPASIVRQADILITAVGKPHFVQESWLKQGCVVIDVGITPVPHSVAKEGHVLVGDVDHEGARRVARQITPIGAVGPMTIAMLLRNLVQSYKRQQKAALRASF